MEAHGLTQDCGQNPNLSRNLLPSKISDGLLDGLTDLSHAVT